jgi:uncharacterized membrane protein YqhA
MPSLVIVRVSWYEFLVKELDESRDDNCGVIIVAPSGGLKVKVA